MKDLGAKAFSYGYASPVLMAATYNDDGTVNMIFYESFGNSYFKLGEKVGKVWSEGKIFMD